MNMTWTVGNTPRRAAAFVFATLFALFPLLTGCDGKKASAHPRTRGTYLVLILDETESFADHWQESVRAATAAVARLYPGDRLLVLGLDHHAWNEDDVLVSLTTLPYQSLLAVKEKARLVARLKGLKPRPSSSGTLVNGRPRGTPRGTDTEGILDFASKLAEEPEGRRVILGLFSDLNDEPRGVRTTRQNPNPFPSGTRFNALYVDAGSGSQTVARIRRWEDTLRGVFGVDCTAQDFHLASQSSAVDLLGRRGE